MNRMNKNAFPTIRITVILAMAILSIPLCAGCRRPSAGMADFARKFLDSAQQTYMSLMTLQDAVKQKKDIDQLSMDKSPAILMVSAAEDTLNLYKSLQLEYRKSLGANGNPAGADAEGELKLAAVRDSFTVCAYRLVFEVKDILPQYMIMQLQKQGSDAILEKTRIILDMKQAVSPPADTCMNLESALKDAKQFFGIQ
jgi:hypothetical protein